MANGRFIKSWCKTLPVLALSTGESELAAITKGISEALGARAILRDFGCQVKLHIRSDASAAIGICKRQGLGRIRHLAVADLWCQQLVRSKEVMLSKWPGKENPADLYTKYLCRPDILSHLLRMNMVVGDGRWVRNSLPNFLLRIRVISPHPSQR